MKWAPGKNRRSLIGLPCLDLEPEQPAFPFDAHRSRLVLHAPRSMAYGTRRASSHRGLAGENTDRFSILLGAGRRRQMHFNARVVLIDVLVEVGFHDAVVIDAESLTEGILRDLEPAIDVSP